ncbi:MAG: radical SAM protein [Candidatus Thorarchaeota archaeon]
MHLPDGFVKLDLKFVEDITDGLTDLTQGNLNKMRVASIIDISLVDVPGIPVTVIFTGGCNFDCPYCQNAELIPMNSGEELSPSEIVSRVRGHLTDGYCISGGEPTIHRDLPDVLKALRDDGAGHININTQGSIPSTLEKCLPHIDSVWFDIKSTSDSYHKVARPQHEPWELITKSIELVLKSDVAFWPRTTYVGGLMSPSEIEGVMDFLSSIDFEGEYVIQNYIPSTGTRSDQVAEFTKPDIGEIENLLAQQRWDFKTRLEWR